MKKIFSVLVAVAALFAVVACKSTSQADINSSFDSIYANYADVLDLTGAESYTVVEGDVLSSIAKNFYGSDNGYYFPLIMLASSDVVSDPEFIAPGMQLTVPNYDANINNADIAKKLSPYFKDIAGVYKMKKTAEAPKTRENLLEISKKLAQ